MKTKRVLFALSAVFFTLLASSCSKDDDGRDEERYYVKYEAESDRSLQWVTVNTENGSQRITCDDVRFSQTFGPVKKGFEAKITIGFLSPEAAVSIHVCRGEEPFSLKKTGQSTVSYTIDF